MKIILPTILLIITQSTYSQLYVGKIFNRSDSCFIRIKSDSSIIYIVHDKYNNLYIEDYGFIKKKSDTVFTIESTNNFVVSIFENDVDEYKKFDFVIDSLNKHYDEIKSLKIEYYNKKDTLITIPKGSYKTFFFDRKLFNKQHPYLKVFTNHRNPITVNLVYTKLFLRSSIDFSANYSQKFEISITKDTIRTIPDRNNYYEFKLIKVNQ